MVVGNLLVNSDITISSGSITSASGTIDFGNENLTTTGTVTGGTIANLVIGTDVQAWDAQLDDIAALAVTDGNIIVGDGTNWVAESGATARTSLGLTIGTDVQAYDANTAKLDVDQAWTGVQRGATAADNDGSFDMDEAQHFTWTPTAADELTFTNITVGQSGTIKLVNTTPYAITINATTVEAPSDAATELSVAGTYIISYVVPNGETKALIEVSRAVS